MSAGWNRRSSAPGARTTSAPSSMVSSFAWVGDGLARVADLDGAIEIAQLVERSLAARGGKRTTYVQRDGGSGAVASRFPAPALGGAGAFTRPFSKSRRRRAT